MYKVLVLYLHEWYSTSFVTRGGEIGSISIREKDGALAGRPKGSLSNRERCDAAAGDFRSLPRFGGAVAMLRHSRCGSAPTHPL